MGLLTTKNGFTGDSDEKAGIHVYCAFKKPVSR
jgi:hypothetical protein